MSRKNPHLIMGQVVRGTSNKGFTLAVKFYDSTTENSYRPDAQTMLNELEIDHKRIERTLNIRTHRVSAKILENTN